MMYINARRLINQMDELRVLMKEHSPLVIGTTKTWLAEEFMDGAAAIPGYSFLQKDCGNGKGGGMLL